VRKRETTERGRVKSIRKKRVKGGIGREGEGEGEKERIRTTAQLQTAEAECSHGRHHRVHGVTRSSLT